MLKYVKYQTLSLSLSGHAVLNESYLYLQVRMQAETKITCARIEEINLPGTNP